MEAFLLRELVTAGGGKDDDIGMKDVVPYGAMVCETPEESDQRLIDSGYWIVVMRCTVMGMAAYGDYGDAVAVDTGLCGHCAATVTVVRMASMATFSLITRDTLRPRTLQRIEPADHCCIYHNLAQCDDESTKTTHYSSRTLLLPASGTVGLLTTTVRPILPLPPSLPAVPC